jgi:four helix bundle protein
MTNAEFNESFRLRTRIFAVRVFRLFDSFASGVASRNISFQLGKSASSVGANFRAFCRGRSKNEKYAKICIVVEEADESEYWLQITQDLELGNQAEVTFLLKEIDEIIRVVQTIKSSLKP